jgi:hypothetical protein
MKTYIYLFLITLAFNSCVTLPSKKILDDLEMNDEEGIVIGAISVDKRTYSHGVHLYYSKIGETDKKKTYSIKIIPPQLVHVHYKPDFFDGFKAVHYFKIKKPKGQYAFYAKMIEHHKVNEYGYATGRIDFPFEVEKGKIKYIGELNFTENESFEANKNPERDLNKLKEMFPSLIIEK